MIRKSIEHCFSVSFSDGPEMLAEFSVNAAAALHLSLGTIAENISRVLPAYPVSWSLSASHKLTSVSGRTPRVRA